MNLCDINVWLALSLSGHRHHKTALDWFNQLTQPDSAAFCRATQQGLLRLLTSETVWKSVGKLPLTNREALELYDQLLWDDRVHFVGEPVGVESYWRNFAALSTASPKVWMDAYLAAIAQAHGLAVVTFDSGFGKFRGLAWQQLGT
jgi:toxin-antitoxin system PIN domain toxin